MRINSIKPLTTFLLLVLCGLMTAFAQDDGGSKIYICTEKSTTFNFKYLNCYIECDDSNVIPMNQFSYIVLKNSISKTITINIHYLPITIEEAKKQGSKYLTNSMFNKTYQLYVTNGTDYYLKIKWDMGVLVNVKNKAYFDKKAKYLTYQGEYVLENNAQPAVTQQPVQQQYYQQPVQQPVIQQPVQQTQVATTTGIQSDVDINIPATGKKASDTFVLIIANEDYQYIDKVKYAARDGEIFKEYCIKTLGVPEKQVRYCPNATFGVINGGVDWLRYALENFEGSRGIVYYCGHGIPDEHTGDAYIIPVDGNGKNTTTCYSLNKLYKTLAATNATNITYFMDACFTGANKEGSMLVAARGVAREPKKETLEGNAVVFSASSGDETAMTNEEQHHGLFTYYLLKKIQDTKGDVSYEELAAYISKNVKKDAFLLNEKPQNPVVATSPDAQNTWKQMKLK